MTHYTMSTCGLSDIACDGIRIITDSTTHKVVAIMLPGNKNVFYGIDKPGDPKKESLFTSLIAVVNVIDKIDRENRKRRKTHSKGEFSRRLANALTQTFFGPNECPTKAIFCVHETLQNAGLTLDNPIIVKRIQASMAS